MVSTGFLPKIQALFKDFWKDIFAVFKDIFRADVLFFKDKIAIFKHFSRKKHHFQSKI